MPLRISILGSSISILLGLLVAYVVGQNSIDFFGIPLLIFCFLYSYFIHWIFFIHAYIFQTEHYFDATGSFTYISLSIILIINSIFNSDSEGVNPYTYLIGAMVIIWSLRLGTFLFKRVKDVGEDVRFVEMKKDFFWFFMTWTLSGLWVFLTYTAGLSAMTSINIIENMSFNHYVFMVIGFLLWVFGFVVEIIADNQKKLFRENSSNKGKFISSGLWSWSRHPNYFGEIILWLGVAIIAFPTMNGGEFLGLISPIFVYVLLTKISGIPMLEKSSDKKWGTDENYLKYKNNTPILFLKRPNSS
tara:strand:+ start:1274 stop:2179 length:906 start_codon:yes stop_codon:yes gene_type:complete